MFESKRRKKSSFERIYIYIYIFLSSDTVYLHFAHLVIFFHIAEQTTFSLKFHKFRSPPVNVSILRFAFASSKSKFHGTYWLRSRVSPLFEHILLPWKYSRGIDRERKFLPFGGEKSDRKGRRKGRKREASGISMACCRHAARR